jgi:glutamine---fructose-6-phosphate transaminase (isomerizing)
VSFIDALFEFDRATHGQPSERNSHPHRSDPKNEFLVVHNGIITNYKELRMVLEKKGYIFESDTDTECIAKLAKYLYDSQKSNKSLTFTSLVKAVIKELVNIFLNPVFLYCVILCDLFRL